MGLSLVILLIDQAKLRAQGSPDLEAIALAGRATLERLDQQSAQWTVTIELPGSNVAKIDVAHGIYQRSLDIQIGRAGQFQPITRIVQRDGAWFLADPRGSFKYRPYEAPLFIPALSALLPQIELRTYVDSTQSLGNFVSLEGDVATYQTPLPAEATEMIRSNLQNLLDLEKQQPDKITAELTQTKQNLSRLLEEGTSLKVNIKTGVIEQTGEPGRRCLTSGYALVDEFPPSTFDVSKASWEDRTKSLFEPPTDPTDVILIGHSLTWKPGQPAGDTDLLLLNITSGDTRRVPYPFGLAANGCFSLDRSRVYIAGQNAELGSIGIFEIELESGQTQPLGEPVVQSGVNMFPTLSPNGRYLAVLHLDPASGPLSSQIYVIEIKTGRTKAIGDPMDTSRFSWLPGSNGFLLLSRKHSSLDEPSIDQICTMDLRGELTPICEGSSPVLLSDSRVFFQGKDRLWYTCDLDGSNVTLSGDGLKGFGFPTRSPDGQRLIMMKFGGAEGPRPHLLSTVDFVANPIRVGEGLWVTPSWP